MDSGQNQHNFQQDLQQRNYTPYQQMPTDKRSQSMTTAAIILSTIAMSTVCCIYISFVCGILGIIFALLSKGGELTMSHNAKTALSISILAITLTVCLTAGSFILMLEQYGSIDAFWNAYMEMMQS